MTSRKVDKNEERECLTRFSLDKLSFFIVHAYVFYCNDFLKFVILVTLCPSSINLAIRYAACPFLRELFFVLLVGGSLFKYCTVLSFQFIVISGCGENEKISIRMVVFSS